MAGNFSPRTQVASRPSSRSFQRSLAASRLRHAPRCSGDSARPTHCGADAPLADAAGSRPPASPPPADAGLPGSRAAASQAPAQEMGLRFSGQHTRKLTCKAHAMRHWQAPQGANAGYLPFCWASTRLNLVA